MAAFLGVFRYWLGSDAIEFVPVPGGTPRMREEDPFVAACSTQVDTTHVSAVTVHVAFDGSDCTVETVVGAGAADSGAP